MKFINSPRSPNPRRVRIVLAEKRISLPTQDVDLNELEQYSEAFRALNPFRQVPILELDDGSYLTESAAICRYLDERYPDPPLFGTNVLERARVEMWSRRFDLLLYNSVAQVFRHSDPSMVRREVPQIPDWAEANRGRVMAFLEALEGLIGEEPFLVGGRFTMADICGLVGLDFMARARLSVPDHLTRVRRWHAGLAARPSAVP